MEASPIAAVPESSGTFASSDGPSGDTECAERDGKGCSDIKPLSPGDLPDDTSAAPLAVSPESSPDGHAGAAGSTSDGGLHLSNEGDGDSDGDFDNGLAAWEEFAEEDVNQSSGTVTPLGSSSGSETVADAHPLDAAFYDEVLISDGERAGDSPFRTKEEFFAFVLISSTVGLTERQYNISRAFYNFDRERHDALPCYTTEIRRIIPAAIKAGGLPMETLAVEGSKCWYILPSTHIARDLSFEDTHDLFFTAEDRPLLVREQEPELYDTMFFQHKASLLQPVMQHASFSLNGTRFGCGSWLFISLEGSAATMRLRVDNVSIASSDCGFALDHGRHAGDLVVVCCNEDSAEAGAMLSRHWLPPDLDALLWTPAGSGPTCAIVDLRLAQADEPLDGESAHRSGAYPVGSSASRRIRGVGADGVPTLVVCISLYTDDFVCRERR